MTPDHWRPIATAPNHTRVLLSDGHYVVAGQTWDGHVQDDEGRALTRATWWMPLPPPAALADALAPTNPLPTFMPLPSLVDLYLKRELLAYLDGLIITGENIGDIRRQFFVPWESAWNGIVREETASRERPAAAPQPEKAE